MLGEALVFGACGVEVGFCALGADAQGVAGLFEGGDGGLGGAGELVECAVVVRNNLAMAYRDAGRTAKAIPLLERTLADRERLLGTDHPNTLSSRRGGACAAALIQYGSTRQPLPNWTVKS